MKDNSLFKLHVPNPVAVGIGLVALDVVINGSATNNTQCFVGGSCGNIMSILSYIGWTSYPIARLGNDEASTIIKKDLSQFGVKRDNIFCSNDTLTPVVIENIRNSRANKTHSFSFNCPTCGSQLPRFRALLSQNVNTVLNQTPIPAVFYLDRTSRSAIEIATYFSENGALIIFEPSGIGNINLFKEAIDIADIIKYSHKRIGGLDEFININKAKLQIETLGASGLRYRFFTKNDKSLLWNKIESFIVTNPIDEAGCGDWCTAGIIHALGQKGVKMFSHINQEQLVKGLRFGQALAALKCNYAAARGGMYKLSLPSLKMSIERILEGETLDLASLNNNQLKFETMRCDIERCQVYHKAI